MKTVKMRGQAFVCFKDVACATNAMRTMQKFPFYDRPMNIQFAKSKSDFIAKQDGTFVKRTKEEKLKKRRLDEEKRAAKRALREKDRNSQSEMKQESNDNDSQTTAKESTTPAPKQTPQQPPQQLPPNKILFVESLPDNFPAMALQILFQQFPGFIEARLVPGKDGIAFVEFENEMQSTVAMNGLQGFKVTPENNMRLSYAKQ